jgi:hypothetical protein
MQIEPRENALMRMYQVQGAQQQQQLNALKMQQYQQAAQQAMQEKQAQAQKQAQMDAALRGLQPVSGVNANRASGVVGPRPEAAAVIGQRPQVDPIALLRAGFDPKMVEFIANSPNLGRQEVARVLDQAGKNGPEQVQFDKFGSPVGNAIPKPVKREMVNAGGSVMPVNPYTQADPIAMTLTPGQVQSDATTRRGQNMTDARARERMSFDQQQAGAGAVKPPPKPLPTAALKMQQEALDAIGVVGGINADLKALEGQIESGTLAFGPVKNLMSAGKNLAGMSDTQSRNFATFKSNMERLRNESLRLNTGVQTDGDAQRAWNELFQNINDTDLVKQRLQEIQRINARGAELQRLKVDQVRMNYGYDPLDVSPQLDQKPALTGGGPAVGSVVDGYRFKGGNPADPKSWEKQ